MLDVFFEVVIRSTICKVPFRTGIRDDLLRLDVPLRRRGEGDTSISNRLRQVLALALIAAIFAARAKVQARARRGEGQGEEGLGERHACLVVDEVCERRRKVNVEVSRAAASSEDLK